VNTTSIFFSLEAAYLWCFSARFAIKEYRNPFWWNHWTVCTQPLGTNPPGTGK